MEAKLLRAAFEAGLTWDRYLDSGKPEQKANWLKIYDQVALSPEQQRLTASFERDMRVLVLSGIWCGDCVQQGPLIQRIGEANAERMEMRWLDRDAQPQLQKAVRINAGDRVPVVLFCSEDGELVGWYGDRTLSRYRALAQRQLGASCPLPGAPVPEEELLATLQDWLDEFERVQLLLRLSTRLRALHGD